MFLFWFLKIDAFIFDNIGILIFWSERMILHLYHIFMNLLFFITSESGCVHFLILLLYNPFLFIFFLFIFPFSFSPFSLYPHSLFIPFLLISPFSLYPLSIFIPFLFISPFSLYPLSLYIPFLFISPFSLFPLSLYIPFLLISPFHFYPLSLYIQIDYQVQLVATEKWSNYTRRHKCQI